MSRVLSGLLLLSALSLAVACKENGNDYLSEGLRLLGEAERGDCKPKVVRGQAVIDSTKAAECLAKTQEGLDQLYKARELGVDNNEINNLIADTEDEVRRLKSMVKIVGRMQHEE